MPRAGRLNQRKINEDKARSCQLLRGVNRMGEGAAERKRGGDGPARYGGRRQHHRSEELHRHRAWRIWASDIWIDEEVKDQCPGHPDPTTARAD